MDIKLDSKVQYLNGVGPKVQDKLNRLGIETVEDLLFYFPRTYRDYTNITKIGDIEGSIFKYQLSSNEPITIKGKIVGIANKRTSRRRFTVTEAVVEDGTGTLKVVWFNQPFLLKILPAGREIILNGKVEFNFFSKEQVMESPERANTPKIVPVYSETAGMTSKYIAKLVYGIRHMVSDISEWLPDKLLNRYNLLPINKAILNIHFPENAEMLKKAQRRLAFDELFLISLKSQLSKEEIKKENAPVIVTESNAVAQFVDSLPFKLTDDQRKTAWQILKDLEKPTPMNRLLNGDVGSGKTVVAAIAAFVAIKAGFRAVVMAPTSILANQHYETLTRIFKNEKISVGLWTRERKECSKSKKKDAEILSADVLVGTQALIQKDVTLENLGLVIVDEQHRFGVKQRQALLDAVDSGRQLASVAEQTTDYHLPTTAQKVRPHFLSMTATPIPRTMHLALFGDLDLSLIKEKPNDRKEIKTRFVDTFNRPKAYEFIRKQIKAGRQCFVICPLIEDKDTNAVILSETKNLRDPSATPQDDNLSLFEEDRKSVESEYKKLKEIFPEFKIGYLHGKMKSKEKDEVMDRFSKGALNILVSTSVVEVGVDIPNATVMMIEDAERFGLAQIHQFRGRVGRAAHQSYCFLFSSTVSDKALKRLKSLEMITDGFRLAEVDLETRGPGAIFGLEQSGLLDLKMASLSDRMLIEEASEAAKEVVATDPELSNSPELKGKLRDFFEAKHLE